MTGPLRWMTAEAAAILRVPDAASDKYRRGVLGVRTGSSAYPGAAVLGVEAAWRTGVGMVRYVPPADDLPPAQGLPAPAAAVLAARPETVFADPLSAAPGRADAWLIGSGTDPATRSSTERERLRALLAGDAPLIADAGALPELTTTPSLAAPLLITPHRGEFLALWRDTGCGAELGSGAASGPAGWPEDRGSLPPEPALLRAAAALAQRLGATVLLKGSVSAVVTPGGWQTLVGPATPWLAAAGTGDVLAGALGALVATHAAAVRADPELLGPLAATAAILHDRAARIAAGIAVGATTDIAAGAHPRPITALDVAHALPAAFAALREAGPAGTDASGS